MTTTNRNLLKGKHIIRYDPATVRYPDILRATTPFALHPPNTPLDFGFPDIETTTLVYPAALGDKRWETIELTSSSLFLGSALTNAGFRVDTHRQTLPATTVDPALLNRHLLGFTLFEDLFTGIHELFTRLREQHHYPGLIAVGGPMVTLNFLETAYHLPQANLLVRGEAEMILPDILRAIAANDTEHLLKFSGFIFQVPGIIVISEPDTVNRPENFDGFRFNLDFLQKKHEKSGKSPLVHGLEVNVSRGCRRGCVFCSAVQGKGLRQLPVDIFDDLLKQFAAGLERGQIKSPQARTVNINDDDIMQDPDYAGEVFRTLKANHFKLWGIQTAVHSFFGRGGGLNAKTLEIIDDPPLYVDNNPLVWVGTDVFLTERGKRLGKSMPEEKYLWALLEELEKRKIRNYHYWISSDHFSDWRELVREFIFIHRVRQRFSCFGLIAHSPFTVPYSSTPLYRQLIRSESLRAQIRYKKILGPLSLPFSLPLVERVETRYRHLNRLLENRGLNGRPGFFDSLKAKDDLNAFITLYNFLKQERMDAEGFGDPGGLRALEHEVEELIAQLL